MKSLTTTVFMALLTLFAVTGYSQNKGAVRPSLFSKFPSNIHCTESQLSSFFTAVKGESISVLLADHLLLSGTVTSILEKYSNLRTVIIKLHAFNNSLFSLSEQTDEANNHTYVGRILNPLNADGFELKRDEEGNYQLIKIDMEKILVNCNQ